MERIPHMVSMEREPEEIKEGAEPAAIAPPLYPYGLCLSLDDECLKKLDVDISDWEVGDVFHLHCLAKITSKTENETTDGAKCRVELQVTHMSGESEDEENEESEESGRPANYGHL